MSTSLFYFHILLLNFYQNVNLGNLATDGIGEEELKSLVKIDKIGGMGRCIVFSISLFEIRD